MCHYRPYTWFITDHISNYIALLAHRNFLLPLILLHSHHASQTMSFKELKVLLLWNAKCTWAYCNARGLPPLIVLIMFPRIAWHPHASSCIKTYHISKFPKDLVF